MDGAQRIGKPNAADVSKIVNKKVHKILNAISVSESCCPPLTTERVINETLNQASTQPIEDVDSNLTVKVCLNNVAKHVRLKDIWAADSDQSSQDNVSTTEANATPTIEGDGNEDEARNLVPQKVDLSVYRPKGILRSPEPFPNHRPYEPYVRIDGKTNSVKKDNAKCLPSSEASCTKLARPSDTETSSKVDTDDIVEEPPKNDTDSKNLIAHVTQHTKYAQFSKQNANGKSAVVKNYRKKANTSGKPALPNADAVANTLAKIISENANVEEAQQAEDPEEPQCHLKRSGSNSSITNEQQKLCGYLQLTKVDNDSNTPYVAGSESGNHAESQVKSFLFNISNAMRGNQPLPEATNFDSVRASDLEEPTSVRFSSETGTSESIKYEQRKLCEILKFNQVLPKTTEPTPKATIPIRSEFKIKNLGDAAKPKQAAGPRNTQNNYEIPPFNKLKQKPKEIAQKVDQGNIKTKLDKKMSWQAYVDSKFPLPKPADKRKDETLSTTIVRKAQDNLKESPSVYNLKRNLENLDKKMEQRIAEMEWKRFVQQLLEPVEESKQKRSSEESLSESRHEASTQWSDKSKSSDNNMDYEMAEPVDDRAERQTSIEGTEAMTAHEASTQWSTSLGGGTDGGVVSQEMEDSGENRSATQVTLETQDDSTQWTDVEAERERNRIHLVNIADNKDNERVFQSIGSQSDNYVEECYNGESVKNRKTQTPREVIELACAHAPDYATLVRYRVNDDAAIPPEYFTVDCLNKGAHHKRERTATIRTHERNELDRTSEVIRKQFNGRNWEEWNSAMTDPEDSAVLLLYRNKLPLRESDSTLCTETLEDFQRKMANKTREMEQCEILKNSQQPSDINEEELWLDLEEPDSGSLDVTANSDMRSECSKEEVVNETPQLDGIFYEQVIQNDSGATLRPQSSHKSSAKTETTTKSSKETCAKCFKENVQTVTNENLRFYNSDSCVGYKKNLMHELPRPAKLSKYKFETDLPSCTASSNKIKFSSPKPSVIFEGPTGGDLSESVLDVAKSNSTLHNKLQEEEPPKVFEGSNERIALNPPTTSDIHLRASKSGSLKESVHQIPSNRTQQYHHSSTVQVQGGSNNFSYKQEKYFSSAEKSIDLKKEKSKINFTNKPEYVRRTVEKETHFTQTITDYRDYHEEVIVDFCKKRVCNDYRKPAADNEHPGKKASSIWTTNDEFKYKDRKGSHKELAAADKTTQITESLLGMTSKTSFSTFTVEDPLENKEAEEKMQTAGEKLKGSTEGCERGKKETPPHRVTFHGPLQKQEANYQSAPEKNTEPIKDKEVPKKQEIPLIFVEFYRAKLKEGKKSEVPSGCDLRIKGRNPYNLSPWNRDILAPYRPVKQLPKESKPDNGLHDAAVKENEEDPPDLGKGGRVITRRNYVDRLKEYAAKKHKTEKSPRKKVEKTHSKKAEHSTDRHKLPPTRAPTGAVKKPHATSRPEEAAAGKEAREQKYQALWAQLEEAEKYLLQGPHSLETLLTYFHASHNPMGHPTQRLVRLLILREIERLRRREQAKKNKAPLPKT